MTAIGLMAALTCIFGPLSITLPFTPIPISLATLILYLSAFVLGCKAAAVSCVIYLLLGLAGLPVFSGFGSGAGKLFGPTGGYLIGYLFLVVVSGWFIERFRQKWYLCLCGMILGTALLYLFGTLWMAYSTDMTFYQALAAGTLPFIPGDIAKICVILVLGPAVYKRLNRAGLVMANARRIAPHTGRL